MSSFRGGAFSLLSTFPQSTSLKKSCVRISCSPIRLSGFLSRSLMSRSRKLRLMYPILPLMFLLMLFLSRFCSQSSPAEQRSLFSSFSRGLSLNMSSNMRMPSAQMSAFLPNSPLSASGAMYSRVPMKVEMEVLLSMTLLRPQSVSLMCPWSVTMMFSGLSSLQTMPWRCRMSSPTTISAAMFWMSASAKATSFLRRQKQRSPLGRCSITMQILPSDRKVSLICTRNSCCPSCRISSLCITLYSLILDFSMIFMANSRADRFSSTSMTHPKSPFPSSFLYWYNFCTWRPSHRPDCLAGQAAAPLGGLSFWCPGDSLSVSWEGVQLSVLSVNCTWVGFAGLQASVWMQGWGGRGWAESFSLQQGKFPIVQQYRQIQVEDGALVAPRGFPPSRSATRLTISPSPNSLTKFTSCCSFELALSSCCIRSRCCCPSYSVLCRRSAPTPSRLFFCSWICLASCWLLSTSCCTSSRSRWAVSCSCLFYSCAACTASATDCLSAVPSEMGETSSGQKVRQMTLTLSSTYTSGRSTTFQRFSVPNGHSLTSISAFPTTSAVCWGSQRRRQSWKVGWLRGRRKVRCQWSYWRGDNQKGGETEKCEWSLRSWMRTGWGRARCERRENKCRIT